MALLTRIGEMCLRANIGFKDGNTHKTAHYDFTPLEFRFLDQIYLLHCGLCNNALSVFLKSSLEFLIIDWLDVLSILREPLFGF